MSIVDNKPEDILSKSLSLVSNISKGVVQLDENYVSVPINYICKTSRQSIREKALMKLLSPYSSDGFKQDHPCIFICGIVICYNSNLREPLIILKGVSDQRFRFYGTISDPMNAIIPLIWSTYSRASMVNQDALMDSLESLSKQACSTCKLNIVETHHLGFIDDATLFASEHGIIDMRFYWINEIPIGDDIISIPISEISHIYDGTKTITYKGSHIFFTDHTVVSRSYQIAMLHPEWKQFINHMLSTTATQTPASNV